jgi:hypothetical protein
MRRSGRRWATSNRQLQGEAMPNYNQQHQFYAGVDLHARSMYLHIVNAKGKPVFEGDLPAGPEEFLDAVKPYRKNLVVGCECMFAWYWLGEFFTTPSG